jgi:HlyD family secretion protein
MTGSTSTNKPRRLFSIPKVFVALAVLGVCFFLWGVISAKPSSVPVSSIATFAVTRGGLVVDALEPGSIDSAESQVIRSKVEGRTTIISIVAEGTTITDEDVANKKVLIQLDSADLRDKLTQQEITLQSAKAALTEASQSLVIQTKTNESNETAGELKRDFGLMDLKAYLGEDLAGELLKQNANEISYDQLISSASLGGEASQEWRELVNTKKIEEITKIIAKEKLGWTVELHRKKFVSDNDLKADELAYEKSVVAVTKAETAISLFQQYKFRKQAEKLRSDYEEAVRDMDRIKAKNKSEEAKAEAKLASASATFGSQTDQLKKVLEQIKNCTIVATQPGLVVYAGSDQPFRNDRQIIEGAEVFERQDIIKIPNTTSMVVKAKIHESVIARIHEGQKAFVTVEAIPDQIFDGLVKKVGVLPDSRDRWMSPDVKVYTTDINISKGSADLKPGMTAQIRIIINELKDVLFVPVQSVQSRGSESYCQVVHSAGSEIRKVKTGDYNDKFVEVKDGLKEGEMVAMASFTLPEAEGEGAPKPAKEGEGPSAGPPQMPQPPSPAGEGGQAPREPGQGPQPAAEPAPGQPGPPLAFEGGRRPRRQPGGEGAESGAPPMGGEGTPPVALDGARPPVIGAPGPESVTNPSGEGMPRPAESGDRPPRERRRRPEGFSRPSDGSQGPPDGEGPRAGRERRRSQEAEGSESAAPRQEPSGEGVRGTSTGTVGTEVRVGTSPQ